MSKIIVSEELRFKNTSKAQIEQGWTRKLSWQRPLHFLFDLPLFTPHLVSKYKRTQVWMEEIRMALFMPAPLTIAWKEWILRHIYIVPLPMLLRIPCNEGIKGLIELGAKH